MKHIYDRAVAYMVMALCAMIMGLSACCNDSLDELAERRAVNVNISTRVTDTGTSWWIGGDKVALQAYESKNEVPIKAARYALDATNRWTTETGLYWSSYQKPLDFMGYYPTTATANGLAFAIPTDQSDALKLHAADYMTTDRKYGVRNTTASGTQVDFTFSHRLVKVVLNVTYGNEYGSNLPTLSDAIVFSQFSGVTVMANTTNTTASTVVSNGSSMAVNPCVTMEGSKVIAYTALVAPCTTLARGSILMSIGVNGKTFWIANNSSITTLESGKAYSFNLKVEKEKVKLTLVEAIPDWGSESDETELN